MIFISSLRTSHDILTTKKFQRGIERDDNPPPSESSQPVPLGLHFASHNFSYNLQIRQRFLGPVAMWFMSYWYQFSSSPFHKCTFSVSVPCRSTHHTRTMIRYALPTRGFRSGRLDIFTTIRTDPSREPGILNILLFFRKEDVPLRLIRPYTFCFTHPFQPNMFWESSV